MEAATAHPPVFGARLPERVEELFSDAVTRGELQERWYVIAEQVVRIRFAGPEMYDAIGRAFGHLEVDARDDASLTVDVWDSAAGGTPAPPLPEPDAGAAYGAKYYVEHDGLKAHYQPACGALTVFDAEQSHGWYWSSDAKALPSWERAASIRQILHWWLPQFGVYEVHGGAIGTDAGGVLIVGKGGSGKSTTALSSLTVPGMRYAADDYVAIRVDPSPHAFSLYSSGKLTPAHAERLPHLADAADNVESLHVDDKAVFYVQELFPESIVDGFPLRAVMLPTICDRKETRLVRVPATLALAALAPSTLLQLHPPLPDGWQTMAKLVRQVDCIRLELGSDIPAIPRAILAYLEGGSE